MKWITILKNAILSAIDSFMSKLYSMPSLDQTDPVVPVEPSVAPQNATTATLPTNSANTMLETFCSAIAQMEGANPANNNEGNCRCSPVGYAPMYGKVLCNPRGFAVFPTKALGRTYLENTVHHRAFLYPDWTLYDFFGNYAPSTDGNNPRHYAEWVAERCGVSASITLRVLFA
jgi:hypothetical protein